jgi:hypothetical protein
MIGLDIYLSRKNSCLTGSMLFGLRQELSAPYLPTNGAIPATASPGTNTRNTKGIRRRPVLIISISIAGLVFGKDAAQHAIGRKTQSLIGQDIERNTPCLSVSVIDSPCIEGLLEKNS